MAVLIGPVRAASRLPSDRRLGVVSQSCGAARGLRLLLLMASGTGSSPPPETGAAVAEEEEEELEQAVEGAEEGEDAFDIPSKNASHDRLRRWRQAALVLNASRRFRYTLDLEREEEKENLKRMIGAHAQVIRRFVFEACQDLTLVILMVAAAISLSLGMATESVKDGWYDGGSIFFAVFLVIFVTATSDYRQSLQFQHLNEEKQNIQVEVIRGGKRIGASIFDLVVGDVVPLKIRDQVPADGILISGHCLAIDESSMTGESKIVTGVGTNTEWGMLMANISEDVGEETPLQVRLNGVATLIGIVGLSVAAAVLVVLWISLAYSMRKMMRDKALVRRLSSCETMGSATTICSDKTGTLTTNKMTVVEAYFGGTKFDPCDNTGMMCTSVTTLLIEGIAQNTNGTVFLPEDGGAAEVTGSPTEKAILSWGLMIGMDFKDVRSKSSIIHVHPFNSEKKRGGIAVQSDTEVHIHWKGAAEILLASCRSWLSTDGSVQPMSSGKHREFKKWIDDMAMSSLRCVAFVYCPWEPKMVPTESLDKWKLPEDDLTLIGVVGIKDPCRPGVRNAVQLCSIAGVKVRMVTGDNVETAKAIALECGILDTKDAASEISVIEGKVFRDMSEAAREEIVEKITADIGLSMGISGTEVAKESSDIIILDDDFTSVVKVVRWGRSVYANIQKFIQFQLTVSVAALVINVVAAVSSGDVPLNAVEVRISLLTCEIRF
ncbi:calcium-transporting ATPase 8, plasma membrane-type-like [Panicum miliaceum]|uniref:Calcium-transporting ATPase 8, plasma membrane-type-like n=1 Tax=Panicum miliaceum TaxID=4540 RepID=A0A3L6TAG8_PANMI|nr:calcium-transporting ATPase 8, plasma membrane-type-like [Panicum miliaceum]